MMAKKDSKGAGAPPPPFNASSGEEWQAVDEGGEREGPTSKQTTANTNKDGCLSVSMSALFLRRCVYIFSDEENEEMLIL